MTLRLGLEPNSPIIHACWWILLGGEGHLATYEKAIQVLHETGSVVEDWPLENNQKTENNFKEYLEVN